MQTAPDSRLRRANDRELARDGKYVLYWQMATRRTRYNYGLQHALARAAELDVPLVVLEALRCDYRWASDRLHRFILDGMADNAEAYAKAGVTHHAYVEPALQAGRGLLQALAADACLVVADDYPCFFLPRMLAAAAQKLEVALEAIDSCGLLPLSAAPKDYPTAYAFRRFLQKELPRHLVEPPVAEPLGHTRRRPYALPKAIAERWPARTLQELRANETLAALPIDHHVPPAPSTGGSAAAGVALDEFIAERLARYGEERNQPDDDMASGFSPWLHFGHLSTHEVLDAIAAEEKWTLDQVSKKADGKRAGWWKMSASAESFLDEIVTWREVGHVTCSKRPDDYDRYQSLPEWAQKTLGKHAGDARPKRYTLLELEQGLTYDELWNAAQRQLVVEGRLHNYLRMLWGKKVLEWSPSPQAALEVLIELNNKYALDGRDPNSYSGIFWTLGRYDRPWAPERDIFGSIRYMSSDNTLRKLRCRQYLAHWGGAK